MPSGDKSKAGQQQQTFFYRIFFFFLYFHSFLIKGKQKQIHKQKLVLVVLLFDFKQRSQKKTNPELVDIAKTLMIVYEACQRVKFRFVYKKKFVCF